MAEPHDTTTATATPIPRLLALYRHIAADDGTTPPRPEPICYCLPLLDLDGGCRLAITTPLDAGLTFPPPVTLWPSLTDAAEALDAYPYPVRPGDFDAEHGGDTAGRHPSPPLGTASQPGPGGDGEETSRPVPGAQSGEGER